MNTKKLLVLGFVALAAGGLATPSLSHAEGLSLTRNLFFEEGLAASAKTIASTRDGGFIVAGSIAGKDQPSSAWAMKADANGKLQWRHLLPREDHPVYGDITYNMSPTYNSAVALPDDSVLLCGYMPGLKNGSSLLTRLDKNGKVINEQTGLNGGGLMSCKASGEGIVAFGLTGPLKPVSASPTHPGSMASYWIVSFDANGKVQRETRVPVSEKLVGLPSNTSQLQPLADGSFVFTAASSAFRTEIVRIAANGDVRTKVIEGLFTVALSPRAEKDVVLVSLSTTVPVKNPETHLYDGNTTQAFTRIILNNDLEETARDIATATLPRFALREAAPFRLPDKSLVLFGDVATLNGDEICAAALKLDPALQHAQAIRLAPPEESYWVDATALSARPGEFVAAHLSSYTPRERHLSPLQELQLEEIDRYYKAYFLSQGAKGLQDKVALHQKMLEYMARRNQVLQAAPEAADATARAAAAGVPTNTPPLETRHGATLDFVTIN